MHAEPAVSAVPSQARAGLRVRACGAADAAGWEAFVERCPNATFFHRIAWRTIIEDEFRHRTHYLLAERGGELVGVLPLAEVKSRLFGHSLASLPFAVYGGPAATEPAAAQALIDAAVGLAESLGVAHLELRDREVLRPGWPRQDLYVSFHKAMLPDVEANLHAIPRKQRAMVRKGIRNGLASRIDDSAARFFDLYADNMHRHGTPPFGRRYFARLLDAFGDSAQVLTVEDARGRPVSSVLSFYFRDEVLPYYAGDSLAARDLAANDFKYWELMRRACERGLRRFDYGRSKRGTGSFDFKSNWGFEPAPLYYEYCLLRGATIPANNPSNPKYRAFIALWRRLPRPAVVALGPHLVRNLG